MATEVKSMSSLDTLQLQQHVSVPGFVLGIVVQHQWALSLATWGAGDGAMRFLSELRDKYGCEHLWTWFPPHRTLLVFAPQTMEEVLSSEKNAADPPLKKSVLSRFVPDALVISSGAEWRDRRPFNEQALGLGHLHAHAEAFRDVVATETERLAAQRADTLRWSDFQALALRISHQIILGRGRIDEDAAMHLDQAARSGNWLLRNEAAFRAFYDALDRHIEREQTAAPNPCLLHDAVETMQAGRTTPTTEVPSQMGFWFFVLKDAIELHVARTLALIAKHPQVQTTARQEVRDAGALTVGAIDGLRYVGACLAEQMRLWTAVPLLLRQAHEDFSLRGDIAIAKDEQIVFPAAFYHRDERHFGDVADRFSPDAAMRSGFPDIYAFSAHLQGCAGRSLVTFVLKATLASLLARFRFELVGPAIDADRIAYMYDHFDIALRPVSDA